MSPRLESIFRQKQILLLQSTAARLRLHRNLESMRDALRTGPVSHATGTVPTTRRVLFELATALLGAQRSAAFLILAGRIVLLAKIVQTLSKRFGHGHKH